MENYRSGDQKRHWTDLDLFLMCAFNSWLLGPWHYDLQIRRKNRCRMNNNSFKLWKKAHEPDFLMLNSYHDPTLSLWGGRILRGRSLSCFSVYTALLFRSLCSEPLNATTSSVSTYAIVCTTVNVSNYVLRSMILLSNTHGVKVTWCTSIVITSCYSTSLIIINIIINNNLYLHR